MIEFSHAHFSADTESPADGEAGDDDPEHPLALEETVRNLVDVIDEKVEGGTKRVHLINKDLYLGETKITISSYHNDHADHRRIASVVLHDCKLSAQGGIVCEGSERLTYVVYDGFEIFGQKHLYDDYIDLEVSEQEALLVRDFVLAAEPYDKNKRCHFYRPVARRALYASSYRNNNG